MKRRAERGLVLLDALLALAILGTAGAALVAVVGAALHDQQIAAARETSLERVDRLLAASTLLSRQELNQRLGRHDAGDLVVDIERPEPTLYRVAILAGDAPDVEQLVTVVYRPDPSHAP